MFKFSTKTGRGVSKEEAARRNYFDIFGRHFGNIICANFWYVLTNLVFFLAAALFVHVYFIGSNYDNLVLITNNILSGKYFIVPILPFVPFMFIGPFTAGYTYLIKSYVKDVPTFIISDYFEHTKKNAKQALIVSILSTFIGYLLIQAFVFYNNFFIINKLPLVLLYTIFGIVSMLYIITVFYVYTIMVTFKMSLKVILKNAWTFAILKLPQNVIIFIFLFSINFGLWYLMCFVAYLPNIFYFLLLAFFLSGFTAFTANYYIWHVLNKYIIKFVTPERKDEPVFNDDEYPDFDDGYTEEVEIEDEYLL